MYSKAIKFVLTIILLYLNPTEACKGCVSLDEYNFEKIISKFPVSVVKFDTAYPYGEKQEIYSKLSEETSNIKDIIFAEVAVKDYGEKENEKLANRFGISKKEYPSILLFKKDTKTPIVFSQEEDFTLHNIRTFIRDNTKIYIGLPGCIEKFDKLASQFLITENKETVLEQAEELSKVIKDEEKISAKTYTTIMKKIIESGKTFLTQETERVSKLLIGKISPMNKIVLQNKLNIIRAFTVPIKDEL